MSSSLAAPKTAKEWLYQYGPPSMASLLLGVIITDTDGRCRYVNPKAVDLLGISWSKIKGRKLHDVTCVTEEGKSTHTADDCVFTRPLITGRVRLRRIQTMYSPTGEIVWLEYSASPIRDKKKIVACLFTFADATKMLRKKEEFTQAQSLFKAVFDAHSDSLFILDQQGIIVKANPIASETFGHIQYGETQVIDLFSIEELDKVRNLFTRAFLRKKTQMFTIQSGINGHIHYYEIRVISHFVPNKHVVIVRDSTVQIRDQMKKERMMEIAGHELRTPIAVIKSFTQLIKRQLKNSVGEKYLNYLDRIDNKATVLLRLLNNVLDEVRAGEDKLQFLNEPLEIDEVVTEVVRDMQLLTKQHTLQLTGKTGVTVLLDKGRITQVLCNLLTNAIKYSPQSSDILITMYKNSSNLFISVKDSGVGIPPSAKQYIFEAFYRSRKHKNAQFPGLGLGLYLSNKIITYYGGKLTFSSDKKSGTTFTIELPLKTELLPIKR